MLKFLLDQNLSPQTADFLRKQGWNVKDVRELGKSGASDAQVYELAKTEGFNLITYDSDFSRRFMADKGLPGLILLRVHPQTIEVLHPVLQDFLARVGPEKLKGAIASVSADRYRLRKVRA